MTPRLRALLVSTELRLSGAERIVFELATRLPEYGIDTEVASLLSRGRDDGLVARWLRERDVPVHPIRMKSKWDRAGAGRFKSLLAELSPDVIHAHQFHGNLAARLHGRGAGAKVVSTIHIVERRWLPLRRLVERATARRDDATICVSEAVAAHARRDLGVASPVVIPNGVDLTPFRDLEGRAEARAAFGLPPDGRVVGAVGRLDRQKGFDVLIDAFRRVVERLPDVNLVLCGDGPERGALEKRISDHGITGKVRLLGFRERVAPVYAALDVFCMPSRWEGFGITLVEALACGLRCIASDVDSLPEVMGNAGRLAPPDDVGAWERAIVEALDCEEGVAEAAAAAKARAAVFDVDVMVESTARVLRGVVH